MTAPDRDKCGFIVDFGRFDGVKKVLAELDHTLVLNSDDPLVELLKTVDVGDRPMAKVHAVTDCSCEGMAAYLLGEFDQIDWGRPGVRVVAVTLWEDEKNSATITRQ